MHKTISYGLILIVTFLAYAGRSWGSETLPQLLSSHSRLTQQVENDTIPSKDAPVMQEQQPGATNTETFVQPVVKQVPKSRKKLKPIVVNSGVNVPPTKIIKPKIVIRKINVSIP